MTIPENVRVDYSEDNSWPTSFMSCALAAGSKVKGLPDSQLCQVGVLLVNVAGSPFRNEFLEGVPIVGDVSFDLQQYKTPQS